MALNVIIADDTGCLEQVPNGAIGQVLGIKPDGNPGYINAGVGGGTGGISTDSGNLIQAGLDGGAYLDRETVQDQVGLAIAAGLGLTYNDALNAISGALAIPITSGTGAPTGTANSPTIYTDTLTNEIYYRDATGARVKIYSPTVGAGISSNANNLLTAGTDSKAYLACEAVQDCIGQAIAAGLGLTYNDTLNSISAALAIPNTSGTGIPSNTANSPQMFTDTNTGNIYYRDMTGAVVLIKNASVDVSSHASVDYAVGHPTNVPSTNVRGIYHSANFSIVGGASTDESDHLISMFNIVGSNGGGRIEIRATTPTNPIYINKPVFIRNSNLDIMFMSPVSLGASGSLTIAGDNEELTRNNKNPARVGISTAGGSRQWLLGGNSSNMIAADFVVGDMVAIHGLHDVAGNPIQEQINFVTAIDSGTNFLTLAFDLEFAVHPTYPASDWATDLTFGSSMNLVRRSLLNTNVTAGSTTASVVAVGLFAVGDYVIIIDARNEHDLNASAINSIDQAQGAPANLEIARIVGISGNVLTFDHALCFSYATASYASVAKLFPVENSSINHARITYSTTQASYPVPALTIHGGVNCRIHDCVLDGSAGQYADGMRIQYSHSCLISNSIVRNPFATDEGQGYGMVLRNTTYCNLINNSVTGCRYNYVAWLATLFSIINNESIDDRVAGITTVGVRSKRGLIANNKISRSSRTTTDSTQGSGIRIGHQSHSNGDIDISVANNYVFGYTASGCSALDFFAASTGITFANNIIKDCYVGCRFRWNDGQVTPIQVASDIRITGNEFTNCSFRCITLVAQPVSDTTPSGKLTKLLIKNNISSRNARHFDLDGGDGSGLSVVIEGNTVIDPVASSGIYAISVVFFSTVQIYHNNLHGANRGIYLNACPNSEVISNILTGMVDGAPTYALVDDGGNTSLLTNNNAGYDAALATSDSKVIFTREDGFLSPSTTTTNPSLNDNSTPVITEGLQIVSKLYAAQAVNDPIKVTVLVPFVQVNVTGSVQLSLWAGSTCLAKTTARINSGSANGIGMSLVGSYYAVNTANTVIQARIGPEANTTTVTLRNKYNGLDQPVLFIEEYV